MAEYIERDAAANIFEVPMWRGYSEPYTFEAHLAMVAVAKLIREEIGKILASDVAPVVHGRLEYIPQTINTLSRLRCSVCGWWTLDPSVDDAYNYCPNCGARMDADTQEQEDA